MTVVQIMIGELTLDSVLYDACGKNVVPFCTSGGSCVGSSAENLEEFTSGVWWTEGYRLNGSDFQETVIEWGNGFGLIGRIAGKREAIRRRNR